MRESFYIQGVRDFPYAEWLKFAQHTWLAFKEVTGLDFTDPKQSAIIKSWLGTLSPRTTERDSAPDMLKADEGKRQRRFKRYVEHGGPSRKLMEEQGHPFL